MTLPVLKRYTHRARRSEPGNRSDEPKTPATESAYRQAAKVAERGTREHRAAHPCRLYPGHPVMQGAGYGVVTNRAAG